LVFITINLYNFILCILNNFLKTYLKIITEGFTDEIYPSTFHSNCHNHQWIYRRIYSVGIIHSPTTLLTDVISRSFTVPATMTDECTNGYLRSVFQIFTYRQFESVGMSHYHWRTKSIGVFQARNLFFGAQFPSVKPSANCFFNFPDRYSDELWYYWRKESRWTHFIGEDVSK